MMMSSSSAQEVSDMSVLRFEKAVNQNAYFTASLPYRPVTLFAPTNSAVRAYLERGGKLEGYVLMYHLANIAKTPDELEDNILSELPGNQPIWITRKGNDIYVNDARIMGQPIKVKTSTGMDQYLYKIDRVLEPTLPKSSGANALFNPDAKKFLERHGEIMIQGDPKLTAFAQRAAQVKELDTFGNQGKNTFFIPIDDSIQTQSVKQAISSKVVEGHVIPGEAIFLRLADAKKEFNTDAMISSDFKVLVSIEKSTAEGSDKWIVQSNTLEGDAAHRKGIVQTEVIIGNIPVKNGVVHIISKPLVVIDETVFQTLEDGKQNGGLTQEFVNVLRNMGSEIYNQIRAGNGVRGITVFVPTNEAMLQAKSNLERMDPGKLKDLLKLHIVMDTLTSDHIHQKHHHESENYQVSTLAAGKKLFFNMVDDGQTKTFYVEGGGVNATIEKPDIAATDGVIHLINKVLGFADISVYDKIRTDPMLKETFKMTSQNAINKKFSDPNTRFTILAPSNAAWDNIYHYAPSEYKKLISGNFGYHVDTIMRRHTIVNQVLTIEELYELTKTGKRIGTISGNVEIKHRNETQDNLKYEMKTYPRRRPVDNFEYVAFWNFQNARVIRPNINCTNGIIHIIDNVLMTAEDVTVASGSSKTSCIQVFVTLSLFFFSLLAH